MRILFRAAAALVASALLHAAQAQDFGAAFAGFDTGSDQPIQIEADRLEVRDPEKLAIYMGNVKVRQGETLLEAPELRVFYTGAPTAQGAPGSQVSRIEAGPSVLVSSSDQTASGGRVVLDMAQDVITMSGNVVLTQGPNIVRGERLVVDLRTRQGRMEGGRVQTLIAPSAGNR
ncbi:MAG TPA: LptA/OstA family protein [Afifellaceae bacterium]|nr:LptA/OstA family protein [Afifellaceae bacterium]